MLNPSKYLVRSCFSNHITLQSVQSLFQMEDLQKVIHAFILWRLVHLLKQIVCWLQMVNDSAARLFEKKKSISHIISVLASLHWLPISYRNNFPIGLWAYKALQAQAPLYLKELSCPSSSSEVKNESTAVCRCYSLTMDQPFTACLSCSLYIESSKMTFTNEDMKL